MLQLSRIFWDLCRLRAGPQALPRGRYLLISAVLAGIIVDSFSSSLLIPSLSGFEVISVVAVFNITLLVAVYLLLNLLRYQDRAGQTITAIAGAGFFISLVLLPALLMLNTTANDMKSFGLLILIDNVWRIVVNANIFRHALSISLLMATILSVSYLLLGIMMAGFLLPSQAS